MKCRGVVRAGALVAVLIPALLGCGGESEEGDTADAERAYGTMSCTEYVGLEAGEQIEASEELLVNAMSAYGKDGTPSTGSVKQFAVDLGVMCDRGDADSLMATVADELFETNPIGYSL